MASPFVSACILNAQAGPAQSPDWAIFPQNRTFAPERTKTCAGAHKPVPARSAHPGEKRELRKANVTEELAWRLHQHATEEMGYLAEILPTVYKRMTQDNKY